ncbi:hypothetical protein GX48_03874 [Paracoccidioides brasiliensis]|nr:hypothetical protein GX48_03874 [Paracoccidioides brasiliensis]
MVLFLPLSVRHSRKSVAGLEFTWLPRYYYNIVGSGPMDRARSPSLKGTSDRLSDQAGMADRKGWVREHVAQCRALGARRA